MQIDIIMHFQWFVRTRRKQLQGVSSCEIFQKLCTLSSSVAQWTRSDRDRPRTGYLPKPDASSLIRREIRARPCTPLAETETVATRFVRGWEWWKALNF